MKKHILLKSLAVALLIGSSFTLTAGTTVQAAKHKKREIATTDVQTDDNWNYPFNKDMQNGVHPLYASQKFGITNYARCLHPVSYFHDGWDFGVSEVGKKATVKAIHPGTVKEVRYGNGLGWFVWVVSPDHYVEIYQEGFSQKKDIAVKVGQEVQTGTKIGKLTGTHLHLGLTKTNKKYINQNGYPCGNWYKNNGTWLNPVATIKKNLND